MSADERHVRRRVGDAKQPHLVEEVVVHDRTGWHHVRRITRIGLLIILGLAIVAFAMLWIWRKPLAENAIERELEKRGVQATYTIDKVGLHIQQISDFTIGDPTPGASN